MRLEDLKEETFAQQLNTKFYIQLDERRVELELIEVQGDKSSLDKVEGMDRFVIYFSGPGDIYLPQHIYRMEHAELGELEIFIVPVGNKGNQFQYEAVFMQMSK